MHLCMKFLTRLASRSLPPAGFQPRFPLWNVPDRGTTAATNSNWAVRSVGLLAFASKGGGGPWDSRKGQRSDVFLQLLFAL